jgi:hypothetical protein
MNGGSVPDTEWETLNKTNTERLQRLAQQGTIVQGLGDQYVVTMLELLLGDRLPEARLAHELKVADQLDSIEKQSARAHLLSPLAPNNGGLKRDIR